MKFKTTGFDKFFIWNKSNSLKKLYTKRVKLISPEMDSCKQAAEILSKKINDDNSILDVGCGTGYFYHSLKKKKLKVNYVGIDANKKFVEIGNKELKKFGLNKPLKFLRVEDFTGEFDYVACLNFLSNLDNYHKILERLLLSAKKGIILRESLSGKNFYSYVKDNYLDKPFDLSVFVNTYKKKDFLNFIESFGFQAKIIKDKRTKGRKEMVIDHPHYWHFVFAERIKNK